MHNLGLRYPSFKVIYYFKQFNEKQNSKLLLFVYYELLLLHFLSGNSMKNSTVLSKLQNITAVFKVPLLHPMYNSNKQLHS